MQGSGGTWARSPTLLARLLYSKVKRHCILIATGALAVCFVTLMLTVMPHEGRSFEPDAVHLYSLTVMAQLQLNSTAPAAAGSSAAPVEIWARGWQVRDRSETYTKRLMELLSQTELDELTALCGRCLWHSMATSVSVHGVPGSHVFVATGDIDDQWVRDSAVQLAVYLPRMGTHPMLRQVIEGAIRTQAYYILSDPYANAFYRHWKPAAKLKQSQRVRGKGGWTAERKYELDSGAYFLNLLHNYAHTPGLFEPERLLSEPVLHDAALMMLKIWQTEQHHEAQSPYRFVELSNGGLGAPVAYTGMVWSAFRPSDDAAVYGYNIPGNMYAAGALSRLLALNKRLWKCPEVKARASQLLADIRQGIRAHGIVAAADGTRVYAYEVDGRGNALLDFDDPNLPSLLAMPLLGFDGYNTEVYANTRRRILGSSNPYHYSGSAFSGLGSPHTPPQYVWPLALMVQGLTSSDPNEQAALLRVLLRMQCGNGLMHESVHVSAPRRCTRPHFEWANALLVVAVEQLLGFDCDLAAQQVHLKELSMREWRRSRVAQGALNPLMFERMEAKVQHERR